MELQGKKINFLGDSITDGYGVTSYDYRFTALIEQQTGAICRNYGIGSTRIARQRAPEPDWQRDFCLRVEDMDPDADAVVVFGGTNDFGHGDAPLGSFEDRTPYTFYGAMHTLCLALIEKYPNADIVFITPLHRMDEDNPRGDGCKPCDVAPLSRYVEIIREVAAWYSLPVLDLWSAGGFQPQLPVIRERYTLPDGLHPTNAGHAILARRIIAYLKTL